MKKSEKNIRKLLSTVDSYYEYKWKTSGIHEQLGVDTKHITPPTRRYPKPIIKNLSRKFVLVWIT